MNCKITVYLGTQIENETDHVPYLFVAIDWMVKYKNN